MKKEEKHEVKAPEIKGSVGSFGVKQTVTGDVKSQREYEEQVQREKEACDPTLENANIPVKKCEPLSTIDPEDGSVKSKYQPSKK